MVLHTSCHFFGLFGLIKKHAALRTVRPIGILFALFCLPLLSLTTRRCAKGRIKLSTSSYWAWPPNITGGQIRLSNHHLFISAWNPDHAGCKKGLSNHQPAHTENRPPTCSNWDWTPDHVHDPDAEHVCTVNHQSLDDRAAQCLCACLENQTKLEIIVKSSQKFTLQASSVNHRGLRPAGCGCACASSLFFFCDRTGTVVLVLEHHTK